MNNSERELKIAHGVGHMSDSLSQAQKLDMFMQLFHPDTKGSVRKSAELQRYPRRREARITHRKGRRN